MKSCAIVALSAVVLIAGISAGNAIGQTATNTAEAHVAAARAASGQEHMGLFDRVCPAPAPAGAQAAARGQAPAAGQPQGQRQAGQRQGPPDRSSWHAEPVKVFDNLYFVGQTEYSAWAVNTSDGIILIDTIYDYSVEDEVVNGLKKLGLDPSKIKYAIVSHGHADHSGGAKYLQERFGTRIILSAADWDMLDRTPSKPKRDMVATDGQKLTLGDTTVTMYITPGHTPGTISTLIPVKDQGRSHLAAAWGGTAFNFQQTPENFQTYIRSAQRFTDIVTKAGADALIANHTNFDGSKTKLPAVLARKPGERHPYVVGNDSIKRYLKVAEECATAALLRLK